MRRLFVPAVRLGPLRLDPEEAHHVRTVLRAAAGEAVEVFDPAGQVGEGEITAVGRDGVEVDVRAVRTAVDGSPGLTVASAVPKNERADWLVEKLSELGVARWVPLRTARSVVHPAGESKFGRWRRIAVEAAKQSRRAGVMAIDPLTPAAALALEGRPILLSTRPGSAPLADLPGERRMLLVGPEGGWTDDEIMTLTDRGAIEASLTSTILRLETAAIVAAGVCMIFPNHNNRSA